MFKSGITFNGSQKIAFFTILATLTGLSATIFSFYDTTFNNGISVPKSNTIVITKDSDIYKSINMIESYRNETIELKNTLNSLKYTSTLSSENVRIEQLESKFQTLQNKIDSLNSIIIASPEKSLAVPMMRKDIDSVEKSVKVLSDYTENQFQRFYNLFLWICGTIILGIAGLGISVFLSNKSSS
ncbi:hypothetical protein ABNT06_05830 [Kosakonia sacchari]|uniref:hypothetical protein n=1 Tax=Kosakonia sacchari TaxID=1158459 RepID=UPI0032D96A65